MATRPHRLVPMAHVTDVEKSIKFYETIGLQVGDRVQIGGRTTWASMTCGRTRLFLTTASGPIDAGQQAVLFYLHCERLADLRSQLIAGGFKDGGRYGEAGATPAAPGVVYEMTFPFYMPEGEIRVHDPDGYCLLIGQCA